MKKVSKIKFLPNNTKPIRVLTKTRDRMALLATLQNTTMQEYVHEVLNRHFEEKAKDLDQLVSDLIDSVR